MDNSMQNNNIETNNTNTQTNLNNKSNNKSLKGNIVLQEIYNLGDRIDRNNSEQNQKIDQYKKDTKEEINELKEYVSSQLNFVRHEVMDARATINLHSERMNGIDARMTVIEVAMHQLR
jgi:hypothetical protein